MTRKRLIFRRIILFATLLITATACDKCGGADPIPDTPLPTVSVTELNYNATETVKDFTIYNDINNGGTGEFTYNVSSAQTWMSISPKTGEISGNQTQTISVTVDRTGLAEGTVTGKITISYIGINSKEIDVSMVVTRPNEAPTAAFTTAATGVGYTNTNFSFDANASSDFHDDDASLLIRWQWETNGAFTEWAQTKTITHSYATSGAKQVTLEVRDSEGLVGVKTETVNVIAPELATLVTTPPENITHNSALLKGELTAIGGGALSVTAHGFCWSTTNPPTVADSKQDLGETTSTGNFLYLENNFSANTTYFVCAYAENSTGVAYGNVISFETTIPPAPSVVSTGNMTEITQTTATAGATLNNIGVGVTFNQHGHCWSTNAEPTITDNKSILGTISAAGSFSTTLSNGLSGLVKNTTYYIRAYATTSTGETTYGKAVAFTTLN